MKPRYSVLAPTDDDFAIKAEQRRGFIVNKWSSFVYNKQEMCRLSKQKQSSSFHIPNDVLFTTGNAVGPGHEFDGNYAAFYCNPARRHPHLRIRNMSATPQFLHSSLLPIKKFKQSYNSR